ncbi:hypothetical protein BBF96_10490 [Anoxybacter fermentans]|uniref:Iron ABC transporter substrate-binding protein n=1 Tax=Anoxybacter fermentans TaxID=1323375 RepID=A0A3S9SZT1_9FIRM|nr:extracellular solute-binding protein [Anoxybacter fermentans]AZR73775.1 hypothetical protein BBF96_10490 [Anoxybacter fermentans]
MRKTMLLFLLILMVASIWTETQAWGNEGELVIYSGRKEKFVLPLIEKFEQETGIKVKLLSGKATQYAHRIIEEQKRPQADLLLANDAGVMEYLRLQGVLAPNNDPILNQIPANFKAVDGSWVGLSARARIFMYNPKLISEEEMPHSIFDLADPKYKGKFAIARAGNESVISHFAAIRAYAGDEKTKELIRGIMANEPIITHGHTDIRKAVGAGEIAFGLVNNYYFHLQLEEKTNNDVKAIYPDQGPDQMGVFVNVAGVALIKNAPHQKEAKKFIRFLLQPEQQKMFAWISKETPILPEIETLEYAKKINEYKVFELPLSKLGPVWNDTIKLMEEAGFSE